MALLADVHAHLDDQAFDPDLAEVIERAEKAELKAVIANGTTPESNRKVLEISRQHSLIKPALGMDPIESLKLSDGDLANEIAWMHKQKFVAFGEIGLDHYWSKDEDEHKRQKVIFANMLELAKEMKKAIIVHSRKAERECIDMIRDSGVKKVVFHCFGGNFKLVHEIRDFGWCFSVPTSVIRNEHFQRLVKDVPVKQLLTETDAPYQGPEPGMRNEPMNVTLTVKKIAEIKNQTFEEIANQLFANYMRLFS